MTSASLSLQIPLQTAFLRRSHWLYRVTAIIFVANLLLQLMVMLGWLPAATDGQAALALSLVEMLMMFVVVALAGLIVLWCRREPGAQTLVTVAWLNLIGLVFCTLGDGVNKNFGDQYYVYDAVIRHSYLIDSIFCFFPGYALMIAAMTLSLRSLSRAPHSLGPHSQEAPVEAQPSLFRQIVFPLGFAVVMGNLAFLDLWHADMHPRAAVLIWAYSCLISAVGLMAWPLLRAYSWRRLGWVAVGAVLATLADAMIGRFWIADDSFYPLIRYANWIVYFSSQLLLLQLPLRVAAARSALAGSAAS